MNSSAVNHKQEELINNGYIVINVGNNKTEKHEDIDTINEIEKNLLSEEKELRHRNETIKGKKYLFVLYETEDLMDMTKLVLKKAEVREIMTKYLETEALDIQQQIFWRNPGGLPIPPHQDRVYENERHLSIVIPLTSITKNSGALLYKNTSEETACKHYYSFKLNQFCAIVGNGEYKLPYDQNDIVIHTYNNMHMARRPTMTQRRGIYIRLVIKKYQAQ
jgi:ectoine hydroxylase-related dioxygenase (phytanoyl-CoA dioxygenase family)